MGHRLRTWGDGSEFEYTGSVREGTTILYGRKPNTVFVSPGEWSNLLNYFRDSETEMGTCRTTAPANSVGAWLQENVTKTAIASYVGPILIREGYAERVEHCSSRLRFA